MKNKIICISHTHWDREWYLTKESFRMLLIDLVDRVLKILSEQEEFTCFMLDGQVIALEDYLDYRPERQQEITRLIEKGRLLIGPWYILPDEYLISPEGHIRNYLVGQRKARRFGRSMQHGYLPDSFGHPSQIPQILKGLGLHDAIFWRGVGKDITTTEFFWEAKDSSRVVAINMPFSYGIGACLPDKPDELIERFESAIERLEPLNRTGTLLYMQGVDHVAPDENLPGKIRTVNEQMDRYEVIQGSFDQYFDQLDTSLLEQTAYGELRSGYRAYLLGGTLSTRGHLKQRAFSCERLLTTYAEPLVVLAHQFSDYEVPTERLGRAWELYLENMPHDSICGCSIDEVHDQMELRFQDMESICTYIIDTASRSLQAKMGLENHEAHGFCLYNPLPFSRDETILADVRLDTVLLRQVDYRTGELVEYAQGPKVRIPDSALVIGPDGSKSPARIISKRYEDRMELSLDRQPVMYRDTIVTLRCPLKGIRPLSYDLYCCTWQYDHIERTAQVPASNTIENSDYRITVDCERGFINLYDKQREQDIEDLFYYEDGSDAGDEYTYSPAEEDTIYRSYVTSCEISEGALSIDSTIMIPESLQPDRTKRSSSLAEHSIRTKVRLGENDQMITIETSIDNAAEDHRLRLVTAALSTSSTSFAEGHFCIDKREHLSEDEDYSEWIEPPNTQYQRRFSALSDSTMTLVLMAEGIHEYEVVTRGETHALALTLLRCVGWLSRADLLARKGNGGWSIETPGAQSKGEANFRCALEITREFDEAQIMRDVQRFAAPVISHHMTGGNKGTEPGFSLLESPDPAVVFSAVKPAESGAGYMIRLTNYRETPSRAQLLFSHSIHQAVKTNLAEVEEENLEISERNLFCDLRPWQIQTVNIVQEEGELAP